MFSISSPNTFVLFKVHIDSLKCFLNTLVLQLNVHDAALWSVFRSPSSYFDETKSGTIINRFSSDLAQLGYVMWMVNIFFYYVVESLVSLISVFVTSPFALVPCLLLVPLFLRSAQWYRSSYGELTRIGSVTRSPVLSSFTEMIGGSGTVRAFGKQRQFSHANNVRLTVNISARYNTIAVNQWFSTRLGFCSACSCFCPFIVVVLVVVLVWSFVAVVLTLLSFVLVRCGHSIGNCIVLNIDILVVFVVVGIGITFAVVL